jgi:Divergent InlB B-repeat domain/Regulator of chromosome condensation (RCC1) repeat
MRGTSVFLVVLTLIAGMASCNEGGGGAESHTLTIDTAAGGVVTVNDVTIPGKATATCDAGTAVGLETAPNADYRFVRWIGDVGTVADQTASITAITMNGDHQIIAYVEANFAVSASGGHTVGLKSHGTVIAVGNNEYGQCDVSGWGLHHGA